MLRIFLKYPGGTLGYPGGTLSVKVQSKSAKSKIITNSLNMNKKTCARIPKNPKSNSGITDLELELTKFQIVNDFVRPQKIHIFLGFGLEPWIYPCTFYQIWELLPPVSLLHPAPCTCRHITVKIRQKSGKIHAKFMQKSCNSRTIINLVTDVHAHLA